jgi:hypothetical protein
MQLPQKSASDSPCELVACQADRDQLRVFDDTVLPRGERADTTVC